jgi:hypothetical protein
MSADALENVDLAVLDPEDNVAYLPKPIPTVRDGEIANLLSGSIAEQSLARLQRRITDGHAAVLRAFAERMASAAVRTGSMEQLRFGLVALLLGIGRGDSRDGWAILPLFYDALLKLHEDPLAFMGSIRQVVGDSVAVPFAKFLSRSDKTLEAMGYREGADADGFRYVRTW